MSDVAEGFDVCAAAQFERVSARFQNSDHVAIFVAEECYCSNLLSVLHGGLVVTTTVVGQ